MWAGGPAMPSGEPQAEPTIGKAINGGYDCWRPSATGVTGSPRSRCAVSLTRRRCRASGALGRLRLLAAKKFVVEFIKQT